MPAASHVVSNFLGGELSLFAQGRYDRPDYKISLKVCLNAFPTESGAWARRPGSQYAGHTRGGAKGRVARFDFEQSSPITMEFTDGFLRFRSGPALITTNDAQSISSISTANPAVVQTATAHGWSTGNTVIFPPPIAPLLENRQFLITVIDTTHFSLSDALTGVSIDGSTLGTIASNPTVQRVHELQTSYIGGLWSGIRSVQAETTAILLQGSVAPQALTVSTLPAPGLNAQFAISPAVFNDGPYLDPLTNGAQVVPSAQSGIITLTISFPTFSSSQVYGKGQFVTSSSVNYVSLIDQNVGNTPASSPQAWATTPANAAINNGKGFTGGDVGRLVRLLSEPAPWASGTSYGVGAIISYNPSGVPGAATYWSSLTASNSGNTPGTDTKNWSLLTSQQGAIIWTWGKITAISNVIASSGSFIGGMTAGGGLGAAFDGVFTKSGGASAENFTSGGSVGYGTQLSLSSFVGQNYGGSAQQIAQAIIYPSTDFGLGTGTYNWHSLLNPGTPIQQTIPQSAPFIPTFVLNLRGSNSAPTSASNGTLLGTSGATGNLNSPVTITSTNQTTSYQYVWIELVATFTALATVFNTGAQANTDSYQFTNTIAQVSFFNPQGSASSAGVSLEILGPALLYSGGTIVTWRLGAYSNNTGWPTCGCYAEGRLFLGGAQANRWDACVSNGILGSTVNFAPTDQFGVVSANSAMSFTFNSDSVNPITWMIPALEGVLMGTLANEWLVQAPTSGPLSPTNVAARRVTRIGSANVEPRRTEHTTLFVKRYNQKLMEYFADVFSGKYSAPNLADKAQHIPRTGIQELAYTEAVTPIAWGRNTDLSWFGITYKRLTLSSAEGPTFYGWHRHQLGTGRGVESICGGPSVGGTLDALTLVTNDATTGIRHVEVLTDVPDELTTITSSWFLDDAINPTSVSSSAVAIPGAPFGGMTMNGLWHLNGKTVQVFAGGLDCGDPGEQNPFSDFLVSNGSIFVPYGDGISAGSGRGQFTQTFATGLPLSQIVIGATYTSQGQIVKHILPQDSGSPNGPAFAKKSRVDRVNLQVVNSQGLSIGSDFNNLMPANYRNGDSINYTTLFTGIHTVEPKGDFSYNDTVCWQVSRPWPTTITAIGPNLSTQDR